MAWRVSGAAAVVAVGGVSRYLGRGDAVPEGADEASIDHLVAVGLIEAVADAPEVAEEPAAPAEEAAPAAEAKPAPRKR